MLQQRAGGHDHARRAEAALQAVAVDEGLLDRVALAARAQAFDGGDRRPSACSASIVQLFTGSAVEQHRAGAALAGVAADVGAGQAERARAALRPAGVRLDLQLHGLAVDGESDGGHGTQSVWVEGRKPWMVAWIDADAFRAGRCAGRPTRAAPASRLVVAQQVAQDRVVLAQRGAGPRTPASRLVRSAS